MNLPYLFRLCKRWDQKRKDSYYSCGQHFSSKDWRNSEKLQRARGETKSMASASSSTKIPKLTGAQTRTCTAGLKCGNKDANRYSQGRWLKRTRKSNVNIYYIGLESKVSSCSTAGTCLQASKKKAGQLLGNI